MSEQQVSSTTAAELAPLVRVRITYGKIDGMRYVGNLDMHTVWERTLRRAAIPLAYSKGFTRRPRIQMAASLPLGATSRCEILEIWLVQPPTLDEIHSRLARSAPPGLIIEAVEEVPLQSAAMQTRTLSSEYEVTLLDTTSPAELKPRITALLAAENLMRQWRGKNYDLRPLVEQLDFLEGSPVRLLMRLAAREGATGRPEEVLSELGLDPLHGRVHRTRLIFS